MSDAENNNRTLALIPAGLAAVCLLLGGIFFAVGWHQRAKSDAAASWPSTDAIIVTSRVVERQVQDQRDRSWHTVRDAELAYSYSVGARSYRGTKLDPTGFTSSGDVSAVARYPLGAHTRAFYNPDNPADAALNRVGGGFARYGFLAIGILVMLIGVPFGLGALRMARRSPSP